MTEVEQLIEKFWTDSLSEEERQRLIGLLDRPGEDYTATIRAEFFRIKEEGQVLLPPAQSARVQEWLNARIAATEQLNSLPQEIRAPARIGGRFVTRAAAVLMLLAGAAWLGKIAFRQKTVSLADQSPARHFPFLQTHLNKTDTTENLLLHDGTTVLLSPHSGLSWYEPFGDSSRDISVTGKAVFTVAHSSRKPFTAYSGQLATTALGTTFVVDMQTPQTIIVSLLEGKVFVRRISRDGASAGDSTFLEPGQELNYDPQTDRSLVSNMPRKDLPGQTTHGVSGFAGDGRPAQEKGDLAFDNEPLAAVFRQLNERYKVHIRFDPGDLTGLYFTGSVFKGDSLSTILSAICTSNQLTYSMLPGSVSIKKSR